MIKYILSGFGIAVIAWIVFSIEEYIENKRWKNK